MICRLLGMYIAPLYWGDSKIIEEPESHSADAHMTVIISWIHPYQDWRNI